MVLALAALAACDTDDVPPPVLDSSAPGIPAVPAVAPATLTLDDFRRLHWIAGRWRGFMADGQTFYESYVVQDDSTIVKAYHPDSTFTTASDGSRITLRRGRVTSESATALYVATRLDSSGVDFAPDRGARNAFTWARESDTRWSATLRWTDRDGRPQTTVYALHRIAR